LFNRLGDRSHTRATRGYGRHAAEILQTFRKAACVPIYVAIELGKGHDDCQFPIADCRLPIEKPSAGTKFGNRQLAIGN
jgi:hypothetical protein